MASPTSGWPRLEVEEHRWRTALPPEALSASARARLSRPYASAVVPRIAEADVALPRPTAAAAEEASRLVRDFDQDVGGEVAPFAAVLLRSESASSSQIENLTSGARQIALAEIGEDARANARLIVGNVHAMNAALALSERIDMDAVLAMHAALMQPSSFAGTLRDEQVWIGGSAWSPHGAGFVPPHQRLVADALDDLVTFARRGDVPALSHAALAHAQFETIHPFVDGNGRTGRALVHAMLRHRGLTRAVTVPVSAGLLVDTDRYFSALTAYRDGDPAAIVDALAEAAVLSVANGRELVQDLREARATWAANLRARSDSAAWRLLDVVLRHPVLGTEVVRAELGVTQPNARRAIDHLVDAGALTEVAGRRRSILWQSSEVITALDAFAARAGRRALGAVEG
ncbi:Fic family protein [Paraoerskovia sediminicola]|uniref:Fic family protein n=1 Tax=Paraoerskovia sediminicola TaxID=1138587 RepID=A0ABM8G6J3_9CELL|nr:Fic family protein [Paraoerskovia sediminicola]BDZ43683.1 Fic family protein [Paraoerskovia sediminicola]